MSPSRTHPGGSRPCDDRHGRPLAADDPNILLILMDDAGIENFSFYELREGPADPPYADTINLESFFLDATFFTNAWSNPVCSPTRSTFHTGEYAFRTGIGDVINDDDTKGLDVTDSNLLPRLLASTAGSTTGYSTALFGKWHLGTSDDQDNDNARKAAGYDDFRALLLDKQEEEFDDLDVPFFHYWQTQPGSPNPVTVEFDAHLGGPNENQMIYHTNDMTDLAITWINAQETASNTWFAYLPYLAPHAPFGCPLDGFETPYPNADFDCDNTNEDEDYRGMIEAIDIEIGRLLDGISWSALETLVIIASDNGSPTELTNDPFNSNMVKGTVGQGGVLVPLMVAGPDVEEDVAVSSSVSLNDLYATILDYAGKSTLLPGTEDSVSLKSLLEGGTTAVHDYNYTEIFFPNFEPGSGFGPCRGQQAVQEDPSLFATSTFKYIRRFDGQEALFNLDNDPFEGTNLITNPPSTPRLEDLQDHIDLELDSDLASICTGKSDTGVDCSSDSDCCSGMCSSATRPTCICPM